MTDPHGKESSPQPPTGATRDLWTHLTRLGAAGLAVLLTINACLTSWHLQHQADNSREHLFWALCHDGGTPESRRDAFLALVADGKHLLTDVVTSLGVFAGVVLVGLTGWLILDPLLAALVALNILGSGWKLVRESVGGLMDESVPQEELDRIRAVIFEHAQGAYQAHDLRTRHAGRRTFIEFHLVVAGQMPVRDAHAICDRLEAALHETVANSTVTIHVEPEDKAKVSDVYVP